MATLVTPASRAVLNTDQVRLGRQELALHGERVLGVQQGGCSQAHVLGAFQRSGQVLEQVAACQLVIAGDAQGPQAVHVGIAVGEALDPQRHVVAAEDQAFFVEQRWRLEAQQAGAAEGAVVVEGAGAGRQAAGRGDASLVGQQSADGEGAGRASCDPGAAGDIEAACVQGQLAQAGELSLAGVGAAQVEREAAVTGEHAVVGPVLPAAAEGLPCNQLAAGGLGEGADVEDQLVRFQHAAVGPVAGAEAQPALGAEVAPAAHDLGGAEAETPGTGVDDAAAGAVEVIDVQRQFGVGGFQGAVAVVQRAAEDPGAPCLAQCPQAAVLVVDASGGQAQGAAAFEQAVAVAQGAGQGEVDALGGHLAALASAVGPVVEIAGDHAQQLVGVEAAPLVLEGASAQVDAGFAAECREMPTLVVQGLGGDGHGLRLGGARGVVERSATGGGQPALQAVEDATAVVQVARAVQVQVALCGFDAATAVVERTLQPGDDTLLATEAAALVVEALRLQVDETFLAVHQAIGAVVQHAAQQQFQAIASCQGATGVVQVAGGQLHQLLADQAAPAVVEGGSLEHQRAATGQAGLLRVEQLPGQGEGHRGLAGQLTRAVVQAVGVDAGRLLAADLAGAVVEGIGEREVQVAHAGDDAPCAVVQALCVDRDRALADQGTAIAVVQRAAQGDLQVAITAGQGALAAVVEAAGLDRQPLPAGDQPGSGIAQRALPQVDVELARADQLALVAVVDGLRRQVVTLAAG